MIHGILIFLGAGLGGVTRYWLSSWVYNFFGRHFFYGTLFVNASGAFIAGLLFVLLMEKTGSLSAYLRAFVLIGFLGGYTTFSAFSIETLGCFESGEWLNGGLNIIWSVGLCVFLAWLGAILGRQLSGFEFIS